MPFQQFGLSPEILRAVQEMHYTTPTPIQEKAIPDVLQGKDLLGSAQTGTGKTAAFALPILHRLAAETRTVRGRRVVRSLVLTPTRELAMQIAESFGDYGKHTGMRHAVIYGGVSQKTQEQALQKGVDILVATPGRLLDLMGQKLINLSTVEIFVLDEADRMLDMGFIVDIRRIIEKLPAKRQTLMFSATMPSEIVRLSATLLRDPVRVQVAADAAPADDVEHRLYYVEKSSKADLLKTLLDGDEIKNALVFTRTRHGADRVERTLSRAGVRVEAIHGDKSQGARERALSAFKKGTIRVLVATDIAATGPRHRRPLPRGQLRPAERAGGVRPPDRPHRAGRRVGYRDLLLRLRGAPAARRDRAPDEQAPDRGRGPPLRLSGEAGAPDGFPHGPDAVETTAVHDLRGRRVPLRGTDHPLFSSRSGFPATPGTRRARPPAPAAGRAGTGTSSLPGAAPRGNYRTATPVRTAPADAFRV